MFWAGCCLCVPLWAWGQVASPLPGATTTPLPGATPPSTYRPPATAPGAAAQERVLGLVVGAYETWDSNIFRLADVNGPESERFTTAYVGLRVDKRYKQQEFQLDVTQSAVRYNKFAYLNFDPLDYRGAWLWHLSPRVTGTLSTAQQQYLYRFEETANIVTQRNIVTRNSSLFTTDGWLFGGWHLLAGALYNKVDNSVPVPATPNYRESGGEGGVKYVALSNSFVAANFRFLRGEYDRPLDSIAVFDDGYRRSESEVSAEWVLSAKSTFRGSMGWFDYRADHFSQRDFSGPVGRLVYAWSPTTRLRFDLSAIRDLQTYWDNLSSYRVVDVLAIAPAWNVSPRTVLRGELAYEADDYRNPVIPYPGPLRQDTARRVRVGADWVPWRSVTLGANVVWERRSSNFAVFEYDDTRATLNASLTF